jgi:hypothetical protein
MNRIGQSLSATSGHGWVIATHVEDVQPDEMMRRMAAFQA